MALIEVIGYLDTDDLPADYVDLSHPTGLSTKGYEALMGHGSMTLTDVEFALEAEGEDTPVDKESRHVAEAKVARVQRPTQRLGRLLEVIEDECATDEEVCHGHDLTDGGECALASDLRAILAALEDPS